MKKLLTLTMLCFGITAAMGQTYFDIAIPNGDMESTQEVTLSEDSTAIFYDAFYTWSPNWGPTDYQRVDYSKTGLAPGEGVDASQAYSFSVAEAGPGWALQFRTNFIDARPSGAGSYIITWSVKADQAASIGAFFHVVALWDTDGGWLGGANEIGLDNVLTNEQYANLDQGYVTVSDTFDIPATAINNDGEEKEVGYLSFHVQCGAQANTYYWDNISLQGPESFYDLTFDVYKVMDDDTSSFEGATVVFDGLDYETDTAGIAMVTDLKGGSYDWSVSAEGFSTESGSKAVSQFETVPVFLTEVILGKKSQLSATIYPNPASDRVRIVSEDANIRQVEFYTVTGSVLKSEEINSRAYDLDISAQGPGLYFIKIVDENNEVYTEQLIISE